MSPLARREVNTSLTNLSAEALTIHLLSQDVVALLLSKPCSSIVRLTRALLHRVVAVALLVVAMMEAVLPHLLEDVAKYSKDISAEIDKHQYNIYRS